MLACVTVHVPGPVHMQAPATQAMPGEQALLHAPLRDGGSENDNSWFHPAAPIGLWWIPCKAGLLGSPVVGIRLQVHTLPATYIVASIALIARAVDFGVGFALCNVRALQQGPCGMRDM